jgi:hypothetical protein
MNMKLNSRISSFLLLAILLLSYANALGVTGKQTRFFIDFEPGYNRRDTFTVYNMEGYVSNYIIHSYYVSGEDLSPYLKITPERINNVPDGGAAGFEIVLSLPEDIEIPGESSTMIIVEIDSSQGGFKAYPAIGIPYNVFVLYPYKSIKWFFNAPDMNLGEKKDFLVEVENFGEPTISIVYADIEVVNLENNLTVKTLKTNAQFLNAKDKKTISAAFDSTGLMPGNYRATPVIHWDDNSSTVKDDNFNLNSKQNFRIGTKNVKILNFTKLFEKDSINQMDISIESAWNTRIENIYADVAIYNPDTGEKVKTFKSLNTELNAWEPKIIQAYFDTKGLEKRKYEAEITLNYEGATTIAREVIEIGENINAKTVEEIPGRFKFVFPEINTINILTLLLIIFFIINLVLVVSYIRKKKPTIDPDVLDRIRELKLKYNDEYIKEMMIKKGWEKEKVELMLKEASKKI